MQKRTTDLLIGLCMGYYVAPTITIMGFTVPWALVGLGISLFLPLVKKLGRFLWKLFINEIRKELNKDLNL